MPCRFIYEHLCLFKTRRQLGSSKRWFVDLLIYQALRSHNRSYPLSLLPAYVSFFGVGGAEYWCVNLLGIEIYTEMPRAGFELAMAAVPRPSEPTTAPTFFSLLSFHGITCTIVCLCSNVAGLAKEVNFDTSVTNLNTIKFSVFCYGGCWIMAVWIFIACRMIPTVPMYPKCRFHIQNDRVWFG